MHTYSSVHHNFNVKLNFNPSFLCEIVDCGSALPVKLYVSLSKKHSFPVMHDDIHGLCVLCTAFRKYIQQHSVFHLKRGSDKMKRYVGACVSGDVCIKIRVKVACIYPSSAQTLLILLATSFACQSSDFLSLLYTKGNKDKIL